MPIVQMPDGVNVQFPDDMPREQIRDMIASKFPDFAAQQAPKPGPTPAGQWEEPGLMVPIQFQRGPEGGTATDMRLAMPRLLTDAWNAFQAPGKAVRGEYDQVEIGPNGEVSAFDPRMVEDASTLAGMVSPLTPASKLRMGASTATAAARTAMPELDDLYAARDAAYSTVDKLGARYSQDAVDSLYGDMIKRASQSNISDIRHPKAYSMLVDLQQNPRAMTLTQLDQLRQVIRRDLVGGDAAEAHFGREFIDSIDDFIENAGPGQISGVTGQTANFAIRTARQANTVLRKSETLQDALDNARLRAASSGSGGNIDNTIRQELRKIVSSPKKSMGFSKDELAAMEAIITRGGPLDDALRVIGKLSPTGNGLMAALGLGATAANPLLAAAPAIGMMSKAMSDRATQGAAEALTRSVRSSALPPAPPTVNPLIPKANTTLIEEQWLGPGMLPAIPGKIRLAT